MLLPVCLAAWIISSNSAIRYILRMVIGSDTITKIQKLRFSFSCCLAHLVYTQMFIVSHDITHPINHNVDYYSSLTICSSATITIFQRHDFLTLYMKSLIPTLVVPYSHDSWKAESPSCFECLAISKKNLSEA